MISPLLLSHRSLFFVFGHVISFFGWVPGSSCQWLLNSQLSFQWSCRKGRGHVFLLHYLEPILSLISLQQMIFYNWQYYKFLVYYVTQECISLTIGFCLSKIIVHLCLRKVISLKSCLHIFFSRINLMQQTFIEYQL